MMTGMILIDLQKAFDTINHGIVLQKFCGTGFSKFSIYWFQSYLTNKLFLVNLGKHFSRFAYLSTGVLQGSILFYLLFLILVDDMPQSVKWNTFLYADDSSLVVQQKYTSEIEKQLSKGFANTFWLVRGS